LKFTIFRRKKKLEFTFDDIRSVNVRLSAKVPDGYEEVERYWLIPPFAAAQILSDGENYFYALLEPELTEDDVQTLKDLKERVIERLPLHMSDDERKSFFDAFKEVVEHMGLGDVETVAKFWYHLENDCFYAGRITPLLKDPAIEDISASGYDKPVYVHHAVYESMPTNVVFSSEELDSFVLSVAQKKGIELSIANPIADTVLYDGSRINLTFRDEVTDHGSTFSVRKVRKTPITPVDLVRWNTFSPEEVALLWLCLESNSSMLFVGGTAAGKTTAMNAVALFIPINSKIVSIEDTREIQLPHKNWIPGVSTNRIDMFELLKASLRQRPEYIIVGEVRGKEAEIMFQAMSLGHTCISTVHGSSAESVVDRLMSPPYSIPEAMVASLDLIVVLGKYHTENRAIRRCSGIWIVINSGNGVELAQVYKWDARNDSHRPREVTRVLHMLAERMGHSVEYVREELKKRARLVRKMVEEGCNYEMFLERVHGRVEVREVDEWLEARSSSESVGLTSSCEEEVIGDEGGGGALPEDIEEAIAELAVEGIGDEQSEREETQRGERKAIGDTCEVTHISTDIHSERAPDIAVALNSGEGCERGEGGGEAQEREVIEVLAGNDEVQKEHLKEESDYEEDVDIESLLKEIESELAQADDGTGKEKKDAGAGDERN